MPDEKIEASKEMRKIIPPVDIYETSDEVFLIADMPGVSKDNLQLNIENDELTISGIFEETASEGKKLINECLYGNYYRTFALSDTIDQGRITAKLDNGVLTVILPKHEKVKPKKIEIETA